MIFIILNQLYVGWRQFGMVITFLQSTLKPNGISPEYITDQDCLRSDYDEDTSSLKNDKFLWQCIFSILPPKLFKRFLDFERKENSEYIFQYSASKW